MIHLEYDPEKSKEDDNITYRFEIDFYCEAQAESEIRTLISALIDNNEHGIEFLGYINSELTEIVHKMEKELHGKNNIGNKSDR